MVDTLEIIVPSLCAMLCKQIMSGDVIARLIRASVSQSVHSRLRAYVCVTSNQQPVNSDQRPEMSLLKPRLPQPGGPCFEGPADKVFWVRWPPNHYLYKIFLGGPGGLQTIIVIRFMFCFKAFRMPELSKCLVLKHLGPLRLPKCFVLKAFRRPKLSKCYVLKSI